MRLSGKRAQTLCGTGVDPPTAAFEHATGHSFWDDFRVVANVLCFEGGSSGKVSAMNIAVIVIIVVGVLVAGLGFAFVARRRKEADIAALRREAGETRNLAKVSQLEADRQSAEAEERSARSQREAIAAEQHQLAAAHTRASAQDLQTRADEIDPDT